MASTSWPRDVLPGHVTTSKGGVRVQPWRAAEAGVTSPLVGGRDEQRTGRAPNGAGVKRGQGPLRTDIYFGAESLPVR
jgi:hypothetical protein